MTFSPFVALEYMYMAREWCCDSVTTTIYTRYMISLIIVINYCKLVLQELSRVALSKLVEHLVKSFGIDCRKNNKSSDLAKLVI